jgi:hypothetical protein
MRTSSLLVLPLLAACAGNGVQEAPNRLALNVAGADVTVVAPQGLCFDPRSTDVNSRGAFLLVADCAVTGNGDADSAALAGVMTATVSNAGLPGTLDDLRGFLSSPGGLQTLGKSGEAGKVTILSSEIVDDTLLMKIEDTGTQPLPGAAPVFWRAFFESADRLIGLSMLTFSGAEASDADATAMLRAMAQATIAANPEQAPAPVPAAAATPEDVSAIVGQALDEAGAGAAAGNGAGDGT